MSDRNLKFPIWLLAGLIALSTLLNGCDLPQVSAEDRLFLNLSLDFLDEYRLPETKFATTPVGGLSGITYDRQRDRFYAISDDRSQLAPARFYTLKVTLDSATPEAPKIRQVEIENVTFIADEDGKPFPKGTVDPEGIALSPAGTVFISSEGVSDSRIPPFVREFDLQTGQMKRNLLIPERYNPVFEEDRQIQGVRNNLGFESLTLSPGGYGKATLEPYRLFTATESALVQDNDLGDAGQGATKNRMLHYVVEDSRALILSGHLYPMEAPPEGAMYHGLTELLAVDQGGHFLSLERSFGENGFTAKLFQLATGGANDISAIASLQGNPRGIQSIYKQLVLDLTTIGIKLDNLEGMTLGPRLPDGSQSLILISDNNFNPQQVTQLLLFRIRGLG
ncbi:esterase-like activity of phytase family protein [Leptothermofonsia sichuanensis]|uniref:esterase-like activity of phytase family protein n=1 Tax=Leptothermofonsia sichuanensis TaxID=2917832 RepID=UPI001CEC6609|nr:esterase-like activity of phytase family protein [Leptothermofonsia sichuanensis]